MEPLGPLNYTVTEFHTESKRTRFASFALGIPADHLCYIEGFFYNHISRSGFTLIQLHYKNHRICHEAATTTSVDVV